ncbi:4Fe-4S binding protein [Deltaproteobacteria bacterium OttesenSCG-928-M10]|nr:4Fe-4S binding protein [Deltaproteobacteria bacterium OttesenSCG-928-M10]
MTAGLTLSDGPHKAGAATASRQNLNLWLLVLPQYFLAVMINGPAILPRYLAVLAGSFLACLAFSRQRRQTLADLDWFVSAWLAAALSFDAFSSSFLLDSFIRGLFCGLMSARPGPLAGLAGRPALTALIVLIASWMAEWLRLPAAALPYVQQMLPLTWAEVLVWLTAGLCLVSGRSFGKWRLLPWLAGGLGLGAEISGPAWFQPGMYWYFMMSSRAAFTVLAAFFVAPSLASPKRVLWIFEFVWLAVFLAPLLDRRIFNLDPFIFGALILLLLLPHYLRFYPKGRVDEAAVPVETSARARLACGHRGRAPLLAQWLGLASCRLAAIHDDGPLLCPYGCLGLGDCVRQCPFGAITLDDQSFPVFDESRCRGCGLCAAACPKKLIRLIDGAVRSFIACAARSGLKKNAEYCPQACLGCGRCRKACPAGAIYRDSQGGAMSVNQALCRSYGPDCGRACAAACPRCLISDNS